MPNSKQKFANFKKTYPTHQVTVVCAKCGSCNLDQNLIDVLSCYNCGNRTPWDGTRFIIIRPNSMIGDLEVGFRNGRVDSDG